MSNKKKSSSERWQRFQSGFGIAMQILMFCIGLVVAAVLIGIGIRLLVYLNTGA